MDYLGLWNFSMYVTAKWNAWNQRASWSKHRGESQCGSCSIISPSHRFPNGIEQTHLPTNKNSTGHRIQGRTTRNLRIMALRPAFSNFSSSPQIPFAFSQFNIGIAFLTSVPEHMAKEPSTLSPQLDFDQLPSPSSQAWFLTVTVTTYHHHSLSSKLPIIITLLWHHYYYPLSSPQTNLLSTVHEITIRTLIQSAHLFSTYDHHHFHHSFTTMSTTPYNTCTFFINLQKK